MKELSIEKTAAYDEAIYNNYKSFNELIERLESVKNAIKEHNYGIAMDILCNPYPEYQITTSTELKESEDKQIMKEIIDFLKKASGGFLDSTIHCKTFGKWLTWFEKQESVGEIVERCKTSWYNEGKIQGQIEGLSDEEKYQQGWHDALEKQGKLVEEYEDRLDRCACESFNKGYKAAIEHQKEKPTDKIEPKFKVGDWVVDNCGYVWKIEGILNQFYLLEGVEGGESRPTIEWVNKTFHLWAINDAKDGDALVDEYGIYIFNSFDSLDDKLFICKCAYEYSKKVLEIGGMLCSKTGVKPPTKEQRDLLFRKMKEAGYEWDAEKKELKKIENKNPLLSDFFKAEYERGKADAQKSSWSEEDEYTLHETIQHLEELIRIDKVKHCGVDVQYYQRDIDWLKSLKDRVQPKQEWSGEDVEMLNSAISFVEHSAFTTIGKGKNNVISWLKSLKERIGE